MGSPLFGNNPIVGPAPSPAANAPRTPAFGSNPTAPSAAAQQAGQAVAGGLGPVPDSLGIGQALSALAQLGQSVPALKNWLPNPDTERQFVRQATGGLSDAAAAAAAAGVQGVKNLIHPAAGAPTMGDVYNAARQAEIARTNQYRSPVNTGAGVAGGLSTLLVGGAAAAPKIAEAANAARAAAAASTAAKASRTARLLAAAPKLATGAAVGAGLGAANAPTWQQAPGDALGGAVVGGVAAPVAAAVAGTPLVSGTARVIGKIGSSAANMAKGMLVQDAHAVTPAAIDQVEPQALDEVRGMMMRNGVSLDDLRGAQGLDRGVTAADIIGPEAANAVTFATRAPGDVGKVVNEQLATRNANALDHFVGDVHYATKISPEDAANAVPAKVAMAQAQVKPLFDAALSTDKPVVNPDLAGMLQTPPVKAAMNHVKGWMEAAGLDPEVPSVVVDPDTGAQVTGDDLKSVIAQVPTPRALDLVRHQLKQLIELGPDGLPITTGDKGGLNKQKMTALGRFTSLLRDNIPGYGEALDQSEPYLQLRDSYANSGNLLNANVSPEQFANRFSEMTPDEQQGVRYGMANQIYRRLGNGGSPVTLFEGYGGGDKQAVLDKVATAFGPDAAQHLAGQARMTGELNNNATRMMSNRGSVTSNFMGGSMSPGDAADQALETTMRSGRPLQAFLGAMISHAIPSTPQGRKLLIKTATGKLLTLSPPELADRVGFLGPKAPISSLQSTPAFVPGLLDADQQVQAQQ